MRVQEKQPCKVLIDVTEAYDDGLVKLTLYLYVYLQQDKKRRRPRVKSVTLKLWRVRISDDFRVTKTLEAKVWVFNLLSLFNLLSRNDGY